jgi:3-oxoadipate enol-lactonase
MPTPGPTIDLAKHRIPTPVGTLAVRDKGESKPALLLWPSLFSDHHLYDRLIPLLEPSWRLLLIDGPGFGDSARPKPRTQPGAYADAVLAVMDALRIDRCVFAGTSWGGQIGAHLAVRAPHRVSALLMMNTPLLPSLGGHWFEVGMARAFGDRAFYADGVARAMFAKATRRNNPAVVRQFTDRFCTFNRKDAATTAATTLRHFEGLADVLPKIRTRTCILMGADDPIYRPETLEPMARTLPGARIVVVPDCGHLAPLEAPDAVASALTDLTHGYQP